MSYHRVYTNGTKKKMVSIIISLQGTRLKTTGSSSFTLITMVTISNNKNNKC